MKSGDLISRQAAIDAIANCTNCGTPDELRKYVDKHSLENGWTGGVLDAMEAVEDIPAADVAPVVHSTWIEDGDPLMLTCGNCGYGVMRYNNTRFRPNCGAKMDGERKEREA